MDPVKRISLYYQDARSDKVYTVEIRPGGERFHVFAVYGRRGGSMQTDCKTHTPCRLDEAETFFAQIVKEKKAKGYSEGPQASGTQKPHGDGVGTAFPDHLPQGPMLLNEITAGELAHHDLIRDSDWLLQPKFDGHRVWLSALEDGKVVGRSRVGNEKTLPASVVQAAQRWVATNRHSFVIDGELVGDAFVCFDVLSINGHPLWRDRADFRSGYVDAMWRGSANGITATTTALTGDEKEALYRDCFYEGSEGVVFKRKDKAYSPGKPNASGPGLKLKFVNTAEVICGGRRGEKRSVVMKLYDGTVVGSLTIPPNKRIPDFGQVLSVRYLYRHDIGGDLVQAVYLGVRDDILPAACTAAQLRVKGAKREAFAHRNEK